MSCNYIFIVVASGLQGPFGSFIPGYILYLDALDAPTLSLQVTLFCYEQLYQSQFVLV